MSANEILVIGATGSQGGAVADHLLERDVEVHALTRDPSQDAARDLEERGATLVEGNLESTASLESTMDGVDAVYCVTNFWEHGYEAEVEQGINAAEAADAAGVEHYVYSSVGGAERDTGISHFDSKYEIEQRIDELDLHATIVRPVYFMQNLEGMRADILDGTLAMGLERHVPLQLIDVDDIGAFVAEAFADPERYGGESIELAGDEHTLEGMAIRFADVTDVDVVAEHVPVDDVRESLGDEYAEMFEWFNEHGYESELSALRAEHDVDFTRLEEYLGTAGWGDGA